MTTPRGLTSMLLLCALAGCGAPPQDAAESASAPDAEAVSERDVATLTARSAEGDADAQYELGLRFATGNGVGASPFTAVEWFRAAAEQGHPRAQFEMGSAHLTGEGARPSVAEAAQWYRSAAANMLEAAAAADYLDDVRSGADGADDLLHQGMWLYDDGDLGSALEKLVPLAESGNVLATYFVGRIDADFALALEGDEDPSDRELLEARALDSYRAAAEAGFVWAQLDLAEAYLERSWTEGGDDRAEAAEARRWYQAAADQGSGAGVEGLALIDLELDSGTPAETDEGTDPQLCERMVGQWQWYTAAIPGVLTFDPDYGVGAAAAAGGPPLLRGTWTCDPATASFTINWQNGVIESYTMTSNGNSIAGQNNYGSPITGSRL